MVTLSSVEDDALGQELQVICELEPEARALEKAELLAPAGFDHPERLDTFLDAVLWGAASVVDVRNVQSPFRSGIGLEDYQLDPVEESRLGRRGVLYTAVAERQAQSLRR